MLSANMLGRLGNNLFQIAAISALAEDNNDVVSVEWKDAPYFSFQTTPGFSEQFRYKEPHFHYRPIPYYRDMIIDGYFQSEKYFSGHTDLVKKMFEPSPLVKLHEVDYEGSASIHVRRGDYVTLQHFHPPQSVIYYEQAISMIDDKVKNIYVFSDDMEWCKKNLNHPKLQFLGGDMYTDFFSMAKCEHNIISNSSFSWWTAWLNQNPNKVIIAPRQWFGIAYKHDVKDLYCPNWVIV